MKKTLFAIGACSSLIPLSLSARTLMCEQCEPEPPQCCEEHLFVERSQLFIHAEFLYWTVNEGLLDYAIKPSQVSPAPNTFGIGDYKIAEYDWHPGFRVAASYYRCPRYWEVTAQYTWLYDKGSNTTLDPVNSTALTIASTPLEKARGSLNFHYHVGDLYAARIFDPNPHLRMRVYAGGTASYIQQKFKKRYTDFLGDFDLLKESWRFWGGGLRIGVTADWFWGCQFYLTARTSLATLVGTYKNTTSQTNGPEALLIGDSKYEDTRLTFNTQFLLGPSWQMPCDCWSAEIFAGYEMNLWFNLQERIRTTLGPQDSAKVTTISDGLLGVHGLTVRLTLGF